MLHTGNKKNVMNTLVINLKTFEVGNSWGKYNLKKLIQGETESLNSLIIIK